MIIAALETTKWSPDHESDHEILFNIDETLEDSLEVFELKPYRIRVFWEEIQSVYLGDVQLTRIERSSNGEKQIYFGLDNQETATDINFAQIFMSLGPEAMLRFETDTETHPFAIEIISGFAVQFSM